MDLKKWLEEKTKKTIELSEIMSSYGKGYEALCQEIKEMIELGLLLPVKASGQNGRRPVLYNRYKIQRKASDYSEALEEIRYLYPKFDHQYYMDHPEQYLKTREEILALSRFLWDRRGELERPMSINERSFSIFGKEKFLKTNENLFDGIFRMKEFSIEALNYYSTPEPFFEYVFDEPKDKNILIIENKDTWYTLRKVMNDTKRNRIFDVEINRLLYGEGKKVTRSTGRLKEYHDEFLGEGNHRFYYFGDLDYEGISIFQELVSMNPDMEIHLFKELYSMMLEERKNMVLPETRDHRDPRAKLDDFLLNFTVQEKIIIRELLTASQYIPQEIVNYPVFYNLVKG